MARNEYGFSGLNSNLNPQLTSSPNLGNGDNSSARVISIVMDETHPRFAELGGWTALGAIEYDLASNPKYGSKNYPVAYPISSNIKHFPLKNELVNVLSSFDSAVNLFENNINITSGKTRKYYTSVVNTWNHPHHNGYSFKINGVSSTQNKSYNQVEAGSTSNISDTPVELNLGNTFKEKENIHPLLPFEGDIIYEGRWGNSIRFGSTVTERINSWSKGSQNGDPITIIRNGQGSQNDDGAFPILEDINNDNSSIYLTSNQKIPLKASSTSYVSYSSQKSPTSPNEFLGEQIILSSGRLVFNSKNDHILLSSVKSINLNSQESVNIDSPELSIQADKIYLGKNQAKEPLMLGIQTVNLLKTLVDSLTTFMTITSTAVTSPCVQGSPSTLPAINSAAQDVLDDLNNLSIALGSDPNLKDCNITSKRNYTV